jgi:hypothetical protein
MKSILIIFLLSFNTFAVSILTSVNGTLTYSNTSYQTFYPQLDWGFGYSIYADLEFIQKQMTISLRAVYDYKYLPASSEGYNENVSVSGGTKFDQFLLEIPIGGYLIKSKFEMQGTVGLGASVPTYTFKAIDESGRIASYGIRKFKNIFTFVYEVDGRYWINKNVGLIFNIGNSHLEDFFTIPYFNIGFSIGFLKNN